MLARLHGSGVVQVDAEGNWSIVTRAGRCVFQDDRGCSIHEEPYYPANCAGYPWKDNAGVDNPTDWVSTCPELMND